MKKSKAAQIRDLEDQVRKHNAARHILLKKIAEEQLLRVAAQRGLVPYVRAIEEFNRRVRLQTEEWFPDFTTMNQWLESNLRELGLWGVKLGYDPDLDPNLTVISAQRYADLNDAVRTLTQDPNVRGVRPV